MDKNHRILTRLFGPAEEINGRDRCSTYLYRWTVLKAWKWFSVYIHHFVGDDWSLDLHDHPKRFISIGLKGWYVEETPLNQRLPFGPPECPTPRVWRRYDAPWVRTFPANHIHRLSVPSKSCWTLVIVLNAVRNWGFWHKGRFIPWRSYVDGDDATIADRMKSCD